MVEQNATLSLDLTKKFGETSEPELIEKLLTFFIQKEAPHLDQVYEKTRNILHRAPVPGVICTALHLFLNLVIVGDVFPNASIHSTAFIWIIFNIFPPQRLWKSTYLVYILPFTIEFVNTRTFKDINFGCGHKWRLLLTEIKSPSQ